MTVFTAIGAAIFGAGTFLAGLTAAGLQIAAGLAVSLIAKAIQGQPEPPKFGVQGKLQAGDNVPRSINFGFNCTAGSLVWHGTFGQGGTMSARVIAIGDLPIRELLYPIVEGIDCTLLKSEAHGEYGWPVEQYRKDGRDHLWVRFYDGTQTTADPHLVAAFSGNAERPYGADRVGRGIPYVIVYARAPERNDEGDKPLFQGVPNLKFVSIGTRLYNPAEDSSVGGNGPHRWNEPATWGGNGDFSPVVQLYNLLRGVRDSVSGQWLYGMQNVSAARLPVQNWIAAIGAAQASIPGIAGPEPTYRSGGEMQVGAQVATAVEALLTAANARLVENGGVYTVFVGPPGEPVMAFTDGDVLSSEEQSFTPFFALADTINGLDATYPNPGEGWNAKKAPPILRPDLEARDGNRRLMTSVSFDMVPYPGQVQRLMNWAFAEALRARRHTLVMGPEFRRVEPGDVLAWTSSRNGYIGKLFRVDGAVYKSNLDVILDLTEVDPSDYDWGAGDYRPVIDGPLVVVGPLPMLMTGWEVFPAVLYDDQGRPRRPAIEVRYARNLPDVRAVRVQVFLAGGVLPIFDGEAPYGAPFSAILNGQFLPNTSYEVRGIFVRMGEGSGQWSDLLPVTTPDIRLSDFDLYGEVIGFDQLKPDILEYHDWVDEGVEFALTSARDLLDKVRQIERLTTGLDLSSYDRIQTTKQEIRLGDGRVTAAFQSAITVATGPDSALAQQIVSVSTELAGKASSSAVDALISTVSQQGDTINAQGQRVSSVEAALPGKANQSALNALTSTVTQQGSTLTAQGQAITSVQSSLGSKADASAVQALTTRVSNAEGTISSQADLVTDLASTVNGATANARMRVGVYNGPLGINSRLAFEARVNTTSSAVWRVAGFYLDVNASLARAVLAVDQFAVTPSIGSTAAFAPFIVQGGAVYMNRALIRDLTAENITADKLDARQVIINGTAVTEILGQSAVTRGSIGLQDGQHIPGSNYQLTVSAWAENRSTDNDRYNAVWMNMDIVNTAGSSADIEVKIFGSFGVVAERRWLVPPGTNNTSFLAIDRRPNATVEYRVEVVIFRGQSQVILEKRRILIMAMQK
ncbi:Putative phage tail protein [Devosia crocina]|uniref:Putative phage tail protein n=1 Tax=Devosia crocina TaxID=429728 RepID=A0A1I7NEQ4_9HYPH|nr:phage tail protein [Devosia crocina]SFV33141.1 Putative phage tail protein [Devosia crocina]